MSEGPMVWLSMIAEADWKKKAEMLIWFSNIRHLIDNSSTHDPQRRQVEDGANRTTTRVRLDG